MNNKCFCVRALNPLLDLARFGSGLQALQGFRDLIAILKQEKLVLSIASGLARLLQARPIWRPHVISTTLRIRQQHQLVLRCYLVKV